MSIDTWKKPHLRLVTDPVGRRFWTGDFRGVVYFGKSPTDVVENIVRNLKWGNVLPCA